jgi:Ricin-type beta-trefoil lectin domain
MRQYRGKVPAALRQYQHSTVKVVLAALVLAPLAAWTSQRMPLAADYRNPRAAFVHGRATDPGGVSGPIVSAIPDKCLDSYPGYGLKGLVAGIDRCTGESPQRWTLPGDNTIRMRGKCLAVNGKSSGTGAVLTKCIGSAAQFWEANGLVRMPGDELVNPWSGKCLNYPHGSITDHAQVKLYRCNRSPAQIWYLPPG